MTPKVSIFVVSFRRDLPFMGYLCRSYEKFCTGFREFVVVVPEYDYELFAPLFRDFKFIKPYWYADDLERPFLMHQVEKLQADAYCTGEYIMHVDSDCVFTQPCTPSFYFADGKPVLYRERFDTLTNKLRLHWKEAVLNATGIDCQYDYMVRHPAVHHRGLYQEVRLAIARKNRKQYKNWDKYILSCRNEFPQGFAEHPTQGAVAAEVMPDRYHFVDFDVRTPDGGYPYDKSRDALKANWSHGGIDRYRAELDEIIK